MEIPLLTDIVIILGLSIVVLLVFDRFRLPAILGFLVTGAIAGPHALSLVNNVHEVELMAEIGVIFLLFIIGIKFSLKELKQVKKLVVVGGGLQVLLTCGVVYLLAVGWGWSFGKAMFMGFLLSLSSTAIVLQLLQKKNELGSPHGKTILSVLIFQDIIVVPMMLFTPLLAPNSEGSIGSPWMIALKGVLTIAVGLWSARSLVPFILKQIVKTNSRELFLIAVMVICFAVAWLTSSIGLSLSLGAFLAGLIISESEYSHQALAYMAPFYEIFTSFFFISIGMLVDVSFLIEHPIQILLLTLFVLVLKSSISSLVAFVLKLPLRTVMIVGLSLSQVGEFSFILSKVGMGYDLLDEDTYQFFLSGSVMTMAITPFLMESGHSITAFLMKAPIPEFLKRPFKYSEMNQIPLEKKEIYKDHLIIIGFGLNGRNLAHAAKTIQIPYIILELNADTVEKEKEKGEPILFGDAVHEEVLRKVYIQKSRVVAVAISDPVSTRRIVSNIRRMNPTVHIIVRTKYLNEVEELYNLGADEVIPEEFETSVEIFTRVMALYLIPKDEIDRFVSSIRADTYEMLRSSTSNSLSIGDLHARISNMEVITLNVNKGAKVEGMDLEEVGLRNKYEITLLAIERDGKMINNPSAKEKLMVEDKLILFGSSDRIRQFGGLLYP